MKKPKDEITKKALNEFKQFARAMRFWEEYKSLSLPLNQDNKTFIDVLNENEPIKIIQNADAFCSWPSSFTHEPCQMAWHDLSVKWARICIEKQLYRNRYNALNYAKTFIDNNI